MKRFFRLISFNVIWAIFLIPSFTLADSYRISSGTGFFVSKYGYAITNEHVVRGCDKVMIRSSTVKPTEAMVIATDSEIDLALLKTNSIPPYMGQIRGYGNQIDKGDEVLVMGYPEERGQTGEYKIVASEVMDVSGPMGQNKWLQFEDAARQGNSGGPLLDSSGNVVGVVVGKSTLYRELANGRKEVIRHSDLAISLPYLVDFLDKNRVYYYKSHSGSGHSLGYIEQRARKFIMNIHCRPEE